MALGNHIPDDLLEAAEFLLSVRVGRSNLLKVYRRRAVSSAYYAVFQAICYVFASETVGWGSEATLLDPVFRTLEHERTKDRLSRAADPALKRIGTILSQLKDKRHSADYAPPSFNPAQVEALQLVEQAREALLLVETLTPQQRKLLVSILISKSR
jgi:hypothetical protein